MKIATLHGPRDMTIDEVPLDTSKLKPHDIWVETDITALKIGTDRGNYEGAERVPGAPDYPRWVGDSNLGHVRAVGTEVTRFRVGDRVVAQLPHQSEYVINEYKNVVKVPDGVHSEDAVWATLYTLSAFCYHKALFRPGENVAVVGLGVLGLGAVALGPVLGARVIGIGNSSKRLDMAKKMGAHATYLYDDKNLKMKLDEFTGGSGIDLVILTANPWPAFRTSLDIVRPNGRVSVVSLIGRGEPDLNFNPLPMELFYNKGISIIAASGDAADLYPLMGVEKGAGAFSWPDWHRSCGFVLSLMENGGLEPKRVITHRMPYTDMAIAYDMIDRREKDMLGVIFQWT